MRSKQVVVSGVIVYIVHLVYRIGLDSFGLRMSLGSFCAFGRYSPYICRLDRRRIDQGLGEE